GFDSSWVRSGDVTVIEGGLVAVRFDGITNYTKLDLLTIRSADGGPGETSIGIAVVASQNIDFEEIIVDPGAGGGGFDGSDGLTGAAGAGGGVGAPGCEDSGGLCSGC